MDIYHIFTFTSSLLLSFYISTLRLPLSISETFYPLTLALSLALTRAPNNVAVPDPAWQQRVPDLRSRLVVVEGVMCQVWQHMMTSTDICTRCCLKSDEDTTIRLLWGELAMLAQRRREARDAYRDIINAMFALIVVP